MNIRLDKSTSAMVKRESALKGLPPEVWVLFAIEHKRILSKWQRKRQLQWDRRRPERMDQARRIALLLEKHGIKCNVKD